MKFMPKEPLTIREAMKAYCTRNNCTVCSIGTMKKGYNLDCKTFCEQHLKEVAKYFSDVFDIVEEEPQQAKKPLAEWTLQEVKDYCDKTGCTTCAWNPSKKHRGCNFLKTEEFYGENEPIPPCRWNLQPKPRWTEQDIEDAKAVKRLFPGIDFVVKNINVLEQVLSPTYKTLTLGSSFTTAFPSLKDGQKVFLDEILADGQK